MSRDGIVRLIAGAVAGVLLTGCVYRLNIQQGNLLESETVDQVAAGMTRSQVQFLLGTPTVSDTFHDDRWDYPYYFRQGRSRDISRRWFVVFFDDDDRVERVVHAIAPEGDEEPPIDLEDSASPEERPMPPLEPTPTIPRP